MTRTKLLNAAVDLLIAEGTAGITTGRLTRRAGVVQSAFYNHFSSVAECKAAAVAEVQRQVTTASGLITEELSDPATTTLTGIHRVLNRVYRQAQDDPTVFRMLVNRNHDAVGAAAMQQALTDLRAAAVTAMQFEDSGFAHLPPDVHNQAASMLVGVFLGGLEDVLAGADIDTVTTFAAQFMTSGLFGATGVEPPHPCETSCSELTPAVG